MRYVPYNLLGEEPNIIADGPANAYTKLVLSHWPGVKLPEPLRDDLSCQIAFKYLEQPEYHIDVDAVSNNHFDEDGLVSLYALISPQEAMADKQLLIDIAAAGDFGIYTDRDAARIAFVLKAWATPPLSPLNQSVFALPYPEQVEILYSELLPRLPKILERVHYLEQYWRQEDTLLNRSEEAIGEGTIKIEEIPQANLAIVTLPTPKPSLAEEAYSKPWSETIQLMAVHNQTDMMRILLVQGQRYRLYYRYETWVQYVSRQLQPRKDFSSLAETLNQVEKREQSKQSEHRKIQWVFDDVQALNPALRIESDQPSAIRDEVFKETVVSYLVSEANQFGS